MLSEVRAVLQRDYRRYFEEIRSIAFDSANHEHPSQLRNRMFNFDAMAGSIYGVGPDLLPCTPDAIYVDDKIYFIEFKNGRLDTPDKKRDLRLKFAEGPYIVLAKVCRNAKIRFSREDFFRLPKVGVVVYNGKKNPSEVLRTRYNSRFQLDEYNFTLYNQIYTFTFSQFDRLVREGKQPFAFLRNTLDNGGEEGFEEGAGEGRNRYHREGSPRNPNGRTFR